MQGVGSTLALLLPQSKRSVDGGNYERWIPKGGQGDEGYAIEEVSLGLVRRGHSQACLSHPAYASERQ